VIFPTFWRILITRGNDKIIREYVCIRKTPTSTVSVVRRANREWKKKTTRSKLLRFTRAKRLFSSVEKSLRRIKNNEVAERAREWGNSSVMIPLQTSSDRKSINNNKTGRRAIKYCVPFGQHVGNIFLFDYYFYLIFNN
jgi:hypothetical protein